MRIAAFSDSQGFGVGVISGDDIVVAERGASADNAIERLVVGGMEAREAWQRNAQDASSERVAISAVRLEAPIPNRRQTLICIGKNYHAHAKEFHASGFDSTGKESSPSNPVIFSKAGSSVIGHKAPIQSGLDPTHSVDYEGELALVIGQKAFKVPAERAYDVIFGYTICNDVTSRELQKRHNQWLIGKSLDTFGPMGPWIVTPDELGDVTAQELVTRVNGEIRQQAPIADLIFDIPTLIETITATMTLHPGDMIVTGTPAGVGIGFTPPKYLAPGDRVEVSISGIGVLENPVE
ncbi:MAG: fumarylacetoacetate hydrolase family protein [Aquisalimonadaceae bacterium]